MGEDCEEPEDKLCSKNSDCTQYGNYYCHFKSSTSGNEQTGVQGYCARNDGTSMNGFLVKKKEMSWWSAQNFCASHGKSMASISDLCSPESEAQIKSHRGSGCYQMGTSGAISEIVQQLQGIWSNYERKYGWLMVWLSDDLNDSSKVYGISLKGCYVTSLSRGNGNGEFALCK